MVTATGQAGDTFGVGDMQINESSENYCRARNPLSFMQKFSLFPIEGMKIKVMTL